MNLRERAESLFNLIAVSGVGEDEIVALNIYSHSHSLHVRGECMMRLISRCRLTSHSFYDDGKCHVCLALSGGEIVSIAETEAQINSVNMKINEQEKTTHD